MKIVSLKLKDFRGIPEGDFRFGDFTCFVGPNGIGKTTILEAVALLCSSLDFKGESAGLVRDMQTVSGDGQEAERMTLNGVADARLKAFLEKNIRNSGEDGDCQGFRAEAVFEHEGSRYGVAITEKGFEADLTKLPFWWPGICYFAKFDVEMSKFQLRASLWPKFKKAWDSITGFPAVDPELYTVKALAKVEGDADYVIGFKIDKPAEGARPAGKIHCRRGSAGEKKIIKALSQIVNLEQSRQPHIVLCDNIEAHIYHSRHLRAIQEIKELFIGKQIISATHSLPITREYVPRSDVVDLERGYHNDDSR